MAADETCIINSEKYCLWLNEAGHPTIDSFSDMAEKVPIGGYVPGLIGSKRDLEKLQRKFLKKPYMIEKYIKTVE